MPSTVITVNISDSSKNPAKQLEAIEKGLTKYLKQDASKMLLNDYDDTVSNWEGPPDFRAEYSEHGSNLNKTLVVGPKGRNTVKWQRVSDGTGPRVIYAKRMMIFPRNYLPKTTPSGKYGGPGKKYGPMQYRKSVYHSTAPREFSVKIKKKRESEIIKDIEHVVERATK